METPSPLLAFYCNFPLSNKKDQYMSHLIHPRRILLSLATDMVARLDEAAQALNLCRSDVIRRSLARDMEYVMGHEVPNALRLRQEDAGAYQHWCKGKFRWVMK